MSGDAEVKAIENELKEWFLYRRLQAERAMSIRKLLEKNNFVGLNNNNRNVPGSNLQKGLWGDLTNGIPELEDSLSLNAREMKADLYLETFKKAADLENPCFNPGLAYLQCLQDNFKASKDHRSTLCRKKFANFDNCRKELLQQEEESIKKSLQKQDLLDSRARELFERRLKLLT